MSINNSWSGLQHMVDRPFSTTPTHSNYEEKKQNTQKVMVSMLKKKKSEQMQGQCRKQNVLVVILSYIRAQSN